MRKDIVISERIDKNGTKHQEVETSCDRCGGAGSSDNGYLLVRFVISAGVAVE
ncbi:hypothetical protein [Bacillus subtilis]|uniref:hypothetical protein n=1 Tax=Bacillus subtilis TaxID=1423 RepID=UPI0025C9EB8B|nr:hypothetical protein [Bacillus subtilis]GLI90510.1 hypothetical protein ANABIO4_38620 [Bacillus subtilis]